MEEYYYVKSFLVENEYVQSFRYNNLFVTDNINDAKLFYKQYALYISEKFGMQAIKKGDK